MKITNKTADRNMEVLEAFNKGIEDGTPQAELIFSISKSFRIGTSYTRNILKSHGINLARKLEYDRTDSNKLNSRNSLILEAYKTKDPDVLANEFGITPTRVRQIIRQMTKQSLKKSRLNSLEAILDEVKKDISKGTSYEEIVKKYGKKSLRKLQMNLGFNVFKKMMDDRINDIVSMAKKGTPPKDIAAKHNITLNYTYMILHENGIKYKISPDEKKKRDALIVQERSKGTSVETIAKNNKITPTMVRIILSEHK